MNTSDSSGDELLDHARLQSIVDTVGWSWREMVDTYLDQMVEHLTGVADALGRGDMSTAGRLAHSCAGASANCGVVGLVEPCFAMERAADAGETDRVTEQLPAVSELLERIRPLLSDLADADGATG